MSLTLKSTAFALVLMLSPACGPRGDVGLEGAQGPQGPAGPKGPSGPDGWTHPPQLLAVLPSVGSLDRLVEVTLMVQGMKVDATSTVDFTEAAQVVQLTPVGDFGLRATVLISATATPGPCRVRVTTGTTSVSSDTLFSIVPPIDALVTGSSVQAGMVMLELINNDSVGFNTDPRAFSVSAPGIQGVSRVLLNENHAAYLSLISPKAQVGPRQLVANNLWNGTPARTFLSAPEVVAVDARSPTATSLPELKDQRLPDGLNTVSLATSPASFNGIVDLSFAAATGSTADPHAFLFGTSGDWDSYLGHAPATFPVPVAGTAETFHVVLSDGQLRTGGDIAFDFKVQQTAATALVEQAAAHEDFASAMDLGACVQSGALTPCLVRGQISAVGEVDTYRVDGLASNIELEITVRATVPVVVWPQAGAAEELDPSMAFIFKNPVSGWGVQATATNQVAFGRTVEGNAPAWRIVVAGASSATGTYVMAMRAVAP